VSQHAYSSQVPSRNSVIGQGFKKVTRDGRLEVADFKDGKPGDEVVHKTCFLCHDAAEAGDFISPITRLDIGKELLALIAIPVSSKPTPQGDSNSGPLIGGIMSTLSTASSTQHEPGLRGQTVVVIGGSAGIGLETARRARAEGANLILTARDPDRLPRVGLELGASVTAFDATDFQRLGTFFDELPRPIDHVLVTGPGPYYAPLADFDFEAARRDLEAHILLPLHIARNAASKVRPGGTLLFIGGTGGRRTAVGLALISALTAALPAMTRNLALEIAPVRVNLIAAGFVDTPLSAAILGDQLDARREHLRTTLPIRRVVGPADIAALAVHLMINTAVTGATFDIDGGQQIVDG
jgi:NAD(P)-dependent dehydrogenase (short-subunit alcohol dehydrogenase family)